LVDMLHFTDKKLSQILKKKRS